MVGWRKNMVWTIFASFGVVVDERESRHHKVEERKWQGSVRSRILRDEYGSRIRTADE